LTGTHILVFKDQPDLSPSRAIFDTIKVILSCQDLNCFRLGNIEKRGLFRGSVSGL
jgi:hypothetical protein